MHAWVGRGRKRPAGPRALRVSGGPIPGTPRGSWLEFHTIADPRAGLAASCARCLLTDPPPPHVGAHGNAGARRCEAKRAWISQPLAVGGGWPLLFGAFPRGEPAQVRAGRTRGLRRPLVLKSDVAGASTNSPTRSDSNPENRAPSPHPSGQTLL